MLWKMPSLTDDGKTVKRSCFSLTKRYRVMKAFPLAFCYHIDFCLYNLSAFCYSIHNIENSFLQNFSKPYNLQEQPSRGVLIERCSENMQQTYRRTPMPKCDFNKVANQLYWNHTSVWVFSCKFAAYFQNTFH